MNPGYIFGRNVALKTAGLAEFTAKGLMGGMKLAPTLTMAALNHPAAAMGVAGGLGGALAGAGLGAVAGDPGHRLSGAGKGAVLGGALGGGAAYGAMFRPYKGF
jgi:hypothetical protein